MPPPQSASSDHEERPSGTQAGVPPAASAGRKRLAISAGIAVTVTLVAAGVAYNLGRNSSVKPVPPPRQQQTVPKPQAPSPSESRIDLHVLQHGPEMEIRWNAADPTVATAARGMLIITDGSGPGDIDLDVSQIHSGVYLYKPKNSSMTVLLMIYQPDGSFTGDMKEITDAHPAQPAPSISALPPYNPFLPRLAPDLPPPPPFPVESPAPAAKPRSEPQNAVAAKPASVPAVMEPPPVTRPIVAAPTSQLPTVAVAPPPAPAPVAPQPAATPPARPNLTYTAAPANRYLAPRVIHQVTPAIPLGVAPRIRTDVQLDVSVTLDVDGKVTGAHVIASQGAAAGLLAIEALKAAQLSRFLPAQLDGRAVPGNAVLSFRFSPRPN